MKYIIGIVGQARAGKDSTADILSKLLQGKSTKVPMARELKNLAKDYFGYTGTHNNEDREILQKLGTDIIREQLNKSMFHVERACETIEIIQDYYDYIFCPDLRFDNEIYGLKARFLDKVKIIKVERIDENKDDNLTESQHQHRSENGINLFNEYDYIIRSQSGLNNLESEIKKVLGNFIENQKILEIGDDVEIIKILNENKAGHLKGYIGNFGYVYNRITYANGEVKYKVMFDENKRDTAYFKREELKKINKKEK